MLRNDSSIFIFSKYNILVIVWDSQALNRNDDKSFSFGEHSIPVYAGIFYA